MLLSLFLLYRREKWTSTLNFSTYFIRYTNWIRYAMKGWHQRESDDNFWPPILTVSSRELNCHHIRESWLIPQFSGLSLRDQMAWSNTTPTIIKMCRNDKKKSMFTAAVVTTFTITIHTHTHTLLTVESTCSTIVTNCAYQWTKGGLMSTTMILHFQYVIVCSILESNSKKSGDCWWWPQILVNATMSFFMMMICWVSPLS